MLVRFSDKEAPGFRALFVNPILVVGIEEKTGHPPNQCDIVYSTEGGSPRIYSMHLSAEEVAKRLREVKKQ